MMNSVLADPRTRGRHSYDVWFYAVSNLSFQTAILIFCSFLWFASVWMCVCVGGCVDVDAWRTFHCIRPPVPLWFECTCTIGPVPRARNSGTCFHFWIGINHTVVLRYYYITLISQSKFRFTAQPIRLKILSQLSIVSPSNIIYMMSANESYGFFSRVHFHVTNVDDINCCRRHNWSSTFRARDTCKHNYYLKWVGAWAFVTVQIIVMHFVHRVMWIGIFYWLFIIIRLCVCTRRVDIEERWRWQYNGWIGCGNWQPTTHGRSEYTKN